MASVTVRAVLSGLLVSKFDPEVGRVPSLAEVTGANAEVSAPMLATERLGIGGMSLVESPPGVCCGTAWDLLL